MIKLAHTMTLLTAYGPDKVDNGTGLGNSSQLMGFVFYLVVFLVVIALLFIALKFLKRYSQNLVQGKHMRVLDSLPLDNEKRLVLVEVGNKILLLGAGKEVSLLTSVELNQEELQLIRETDGHSSSFSIQTIWEKCKNKIPLISNNDRRSGDQNMENFEQQLQEELNKMRRSKDEGGHDDGEK